MELTGRPFALETDTGAIADLYGDTASTTRLLVDFPWRLSSPAVESGRNARLWLASIGQLVGFAAWQNSWAVLDVVVRPDSDPLRLESAILDWAERRFRDLDAERGRALPYWVDAYTDDTARREWLRTRGFVLDDEHQYVEMARSLVEPLPAPCVPVGFTGRPLRGVEEVPVYVEAHRAAFSSPSMTADWRLRTLQMPHYLSDLDLVAQAPDCSLAGFCVGWLAPRRRVGQVEPIGVVPAFPHRGLGRALLVELLHRFRNHDAKVVLIEPDSLRSAALRMYEAVGFQPRRSAARLGRWMSL